MLLAADNRIDGVAWETVLRDASTDFDSLRSRIKPPLTWRNPSAAACRDTNAYCGRLDPKGFARFTMVLHFAPGGDYARIPETSLFPPT